jgi:crotonobetainyl-CoA:carnitine CoA-transferase CaiB-like acyl-CoA transferase
VGVALTDILSGLNAVIAILAALAHRDRSGIGQHIDIALLDVQIASLANQNMNYLTTGQSPRRMGNAHPNIVPYQDFPTADGDMTIAVGNDRQFANFCEVIGHPELALDERFRSNSVRVANREQLVQQIRHATRSRPTSDWVAAFEMAGVPCGPINTLEQVFADPHVRARGLQIEMSHSTAGTAPLVGNPIRLSDTPVEYRSSPPTLGEHTRAVLTEVLGIADAELSTLISSGVIA